MVKQKNEYYQMIRGICIISVILIHVLSKQNNVYADSFNVIVRTIINFCVGIFIFLSGYFVNIKRVEEDKKGWILERLKRVGIPYAIYSILAATIDFIKNEETISRYIFNIILGKSSVQLYYILVLIQLTLLTPLFVKIIRKNNTILNFFILIITPIYYILILIFSDINNFFALNYATIFLAWLIYFYIGLYIRINKNNEFFIRLISKYKLSYHIILAVLITVINIYMLKIEINYSYIVTHLRILNMIYILSCILMIIKLENKVKNVKWLVRIGNVSFGIFFIHTYFISIYNHLFKFNNYYLYVLTAFSFVILISYISIIIFKKVTKNKFDKILGF